MYKSWWWTLGFGWFRGAGWDEMGGPSYIGAMFFAVLLGQTAMREGGGWAR